MIFAVIDTNVIVSALMAKDIRSYTRIIDVDDQCFYDAYEYCENKNPYLITGNKRHFPKRNSIVSASEICDVLQLVL